MNRLFITLFLALAALTANAQDILNELRHDQTGQGKIVINQSREIEQLVNAKPLTTKPETKTVKTETKTATSETKVATATNSQQTPQDKITDNKLAEHGVAAAPHVNDSLAQDSLLSAPRKRVVRKNMDTVEADATNSGTVNLNRKVMRHAYKATGYRVQVYTGGNTRADRQKCQEIAAKIKASYPNLPIYVHFYSPSWKCRVGNFKDKGEADKFLNKIKGMGYRTAVLVKGTINVQY